MFAVKIRHQINVAPLCLAQDGKERESLNHTHALFAVIAIFCVCQLTLTLLIIHSSCRQFIMHGKYRNSMVNCIILKKFNKNKTLRKKEHPGGRLGSTS